MKSESGGSGSNPVSRRESIQSALAGQVVAIPENRQLDVLSALFERRGAQVRRVPLLSITDNPDQDGVWRWLQRFVNEPPDLFVIYTGEGLRRLLAAAQLRDYTGAFTHALARVRKLIRGPKPARVLSGLGLEAEFTAAEATTSGIIETLQQENLIHGRIAIQTYGAEPVPDLEQFLRSFELNVDWVAPYIYGGESEESLVSDFIRQLAAKQIDLLAFTSKSQITRLREVADKHGLSESLERGLGHTLLAAVGPVVAGQLQELGHTAAIMPSKKYFMKPMVRAAEQYFQKNGNGMISG